MLHTQHFQTHNSIAEIPEGDKFSPEIESQSKSNLDCVRLGAALDTSGKRFVIPKKG